MHSNPLQMHDTFRAHMSITRQSNHLPRIFVENINKAKSEVNTAKAKYFEVQRKAIGLVGKTGKNEADLYKDIKTSGGRISSETLMALGQQYPDLKDKFESSARLSDNLYGSYRKAQTQLNDAITEYNTYINLFPNNIAAYILGYVRETLIDEANLEKSKELNVVEDLDLSEFL